MSSPPAKLSPEQTDRNLPDPLPVGYARYSNFAPFAEGGGAELQTAVDAGLGRSVVIKTLHSKYKNDEVMRRRFLREARITALLQHPGTCPVYDFGKDELGIPFFSMKKIEGRTLRDVIRGIARETKEFEAYRSVEARVDLIIQVGRALAHAHELGVTHRDVKPANIVIGKFGEVMLMDWGVAKVDGEPLELEPDSDTGELDESGLITATGKVFGTARYLSPEQASGMQDVDQRVDVWSLGVILYEMLTLEPLFSGDKKRRILQQVREKEIVPPRKLNPLRGISAEIDAVCMKALQRNPAERYPSMLALLEDLQRYRRGQTVSVSRDLPWERLMRWRRRHLSWTALLLVLLALGLGLWLGKIFL